MAKASSSNQQTTHSKLEKIITLTSQKDNNPYAIPEFKGEESYPITILMPESSIEVQISKYPQLTKWILNIVKNSPTQFKLIEGKILRTLEDDTRLLINKIDAEIAALSDTEIKYEDEKDASVVI